MRSFETLYKGVVPNVVRYHPKNNFFYHMQNALPASNREGVPLFK